MVSVGSARSLEKNLLLPAATKGCPVLLIANNSSKTPIADFQHIAQEQWERFAFGKMVEPKEMVWSSLVGSGLVRKEDELPLVVAFSTSEWTKSELMFDIDRYSGTIKSDTFRTWLAQLYEKTCKSVVSAPRAIQSEPTVVELLKEKEN